MIERERRRWAGLCVVLTGLTVTVEAIRRGDPTTAESAIKSTGEAMKIWARELQEDVAMAPTPPEKTE